MWQCQTIPPMKLLSLVRSHSNILSRITTECSHVASRADRPRTDPPRTAPTKAAHGPTTEGSSDHPRRVTLARQDRRAMAGSPGAVRPVADGGDPVLPLD